MSLFNAITERVVESFVSSGGRAHWQQSPSPASAQPHSHKQALCFNRLYPSMKQVPHWATSHNQDTATKPVIGKEGKKFPEMQGEFVTSAVTVFFHGHS